MSYSIQNTNSLNETILEGGLLPASKHSALLFNPCVKPICFNWNCFCFDI